MDKKKQKRPNELRGCGQAKMTYEPGYISSAIDKCTAHLGLPKVDTGDLAAVKQRVKDYFDFCRANEMRPGVVMLCNWLGINRSTMMRWARGDLRGGEYSEVADQALGVIDSLWEQYMLDGTIDKISGIFLGKSLLGHRETTEVVVTPGQTMGERPSDEELAKKYIEDLPPIESEMQDS